MACRATNACVYRTILSDGYCVYHSPMFTEHGSRLLRGAVAIDEGLPDVCGATEQLDRKSVNREGSEAEQTRRHLWVGGAMGY